jgi:MFS family permease
MTGLSALAQDWTTFAILRFLVGIAIGSEWATGTAMMAELWPAHARGKGAGLMQCGLGVGFFLASFAWLFAGEAGEGAWRYMYVLGIAPALVTLWIRRNMPESPMWEEANRRRLAERREPAPQPEISLREISTSPPGGGPPQSDGAEQTQHSRFTVVELFADRERRRRTFLVLLMSLTTTLAWWGISSWIPPYVAQQAAAAGLSPERWASYTGMAYNLGGIAGYIGFGFLADRFGRKPVTAAFFAAALVMTPALFLWTRELSLLLAVAAANAFFTLGQYSWMPTWLPELYPTRIRGTAVAFAFNAPRFVAFLGPLVAGTLIAEFGGYGNAAVSVAAIYLLGLSVVWLVPETRGKPLPQ